MLDNFENFASQLTEKGAKFVELFFTDKSGRWRRMSISAREINSASLSNGFNIPRNIFDSDIDLDFGNILLRPDLSSVFDDSFSSHPSINVVCFVDEANGSNKASDSRRTASRADKFVFDQCESVVFADIDFHFFIFDSVEFSQSESRTFIKIDSEEDIENSGKEYEYGNCGWRMPKGRCGMICPPIDSLADIRAEIMQVSIASGVQVYSHMHGSMPGSNIIRFKSETIKCIGDDIQKIKHVIRNVASAYGKTATFMSSVFPNSNCFPGGISLGLDLRKDGRSVLFDGESQTNLFTSFITLTKKYFDLVIPFAFPSSAGRDIFFGRNGNIDISNNLLFFPSFDGVCNPYLVLSCLLSIGFSSFDDLDISSKFLGEPSSSLDCNYDLLLISSLEKRAGILVDSGIFVDTQIRDTIEQLNKQANKYFINTSEFLSFYSV